MSKIWVVNDVFKRYFSDTCGWIKGKASKLIIWQMHVRITLLRSSNIVYKVTGTHQKKHYHDYSSYSVFPYLTRKSWDKETLSIVRFCFNPISRGIERIIFYTLNHETKDLSFLDFLFCYITFKTMTDCFVTYHIFVGIKCIEDQSLE